MAILGPSTDYTDRDFDALRARCRNLIRGVYPTWTDEDVASFANLLVDLFCFVGDVTAKYQDNQAAEAFWGRVTQRKNILALCKLIAYTPRGGSVSQVDVRIALPTAAAADVPIPARTRVRTEEVANPVVFELLSEIMILAGSTDPVTVTAENAELQEDTFALSGRPNVEIELTRTPFVDGSLTFSAGNGAYELVSDFLDSTASDRHYTIAVDQNDRARVRFGNGINGAPPVGTGVASYKTGGGSRGRVEASTVRVIEGTFVDELGNSVQPTVTNPEPSSIATDRQTVEQIRAEGPRALRALTRCVAREDFQINALQVPGVARALMLTSDQDSSIAENSGILFIVPSGGGAPTDALKDAVLAKVTVEKPSTLTFRVEVRGAVYRVVNVTAVVFFASGVNTLPKKVAVRNAILASLRTAFDPDVDPDTIDSDVVVDFGYNMIDDDDADGVSLAWSDLLDVVRDTPGVGRIDPSSGFLINGEVADLVLERREFPTLGVVTIIDGSTGNPV